MTDFSIASFENSSKQNGIRYWPAHEFMEKLGYENWSSFKGVLNKAIALCARVGVDAMEAFIPYEATDAQGKRFNSYKLTRFGCLLVTMQADTKKAQVAQAQVAMAAIADALVERYLNTNALERLEKREELKIGEQLLSGQAQTVGVQSAEFGIFKSAGFRGMYNMTQEQLKVYKGASNHKGTLYDLMGITEMAANTFRVTQTAERLKNSGASGIKQASTVAHQVGKEVRDVMIKSGGTRPENLPLEEDLNTVKKGIKSTQRQMLKVDGGKKGGKPG